MSKVTVRLIISLLAVFFICSASYCKEEPYNPEPRACLVFENLSEESIKLICTTAKDYDDFDFNASENYVLIIMKQLAPSESFKTSCAISLKEFKEGLKCQVLLFKQSTLDKKQESFNYIEIPVDKRYVFGYDDLVDNTFYIKYTGE